MLNHYYNDISNNNKSTNYLTNYCKAGIVTSKIIYGDIWLSDGDTGSHSVSVGTPSGYSIIGIGRCQCSNTSNIIPYNVYISGNTLTAWCRNLTNSTVYTGNMNYTIFFSRNF